MVKIDIDMPKSCADCPCCQPDVHFMLYSCGVNGDDVMDDTTGEILNTRPCGCPMEGGDENELG